MGILVGFRIVSLGLSVVPLFCLGGVKPFCRVVYRALLWVAVIRVLEVGCLIFTLKCFAGWIMGFVLF